MLPRTFKRVLNKIARAKINGNWFFIGSIGQELEGMRFSWVPRDIDIAVDEETLQKFITLFGKPEKTKNKSAFFNVDGVVVELCLKPNDYKFFKLAKKKNGLNTISLQDQIARYELAGSREKALKIKQFLENKN